MADVNVNSSKEKSHSGRPIKCNLCKVWCSGIISYQSHLQGQQHFTNLTKPDDGETKNGTEAPAKGKKRPSAQVLDEICCEVCNVSCLGQQQYQTHVSGMKHLKKMKEKESDSEDTMSYSFVKELIEGKIYECTICSVKMSGKPSVVSHVNGNKHKKKATADLSKPTPAKASKKSETTTPSGESLDCKICKVPINSLFQLTEHESSIRHKHKAAMFHKQALEEANIGQDYDAWDPTE